MRVLLVRPGQQGEASARRLVLRGHAPLAVPLFAVRPTGTSPPPERPDAILVTSANAAPALAGEAGRLGAVPVYAVGAATARAVARAGYGAVHRAGGDGAALAREIAAAFPKGARLLHVAGRDRRPEPERTLLRLGFAVSVWEAYAAEAAATLPAVVATALAGDRLDAVLHYSRRGAETLGRLADEAGLAAGLGGLAHLCLSSEVARGLGTRPPPATVTAAEPTEEALFAALDRLSARPGDRQARAEPGRDARQGTNPAARHSRTVKDDPPAMSETRRQDPLRRAPPTIDLKAQEIAGSASKAGGPTPADGEPAGAEKPAAEGASAVEPVATTGLGAEPFPRRAEPADKAAADTAAAKPPAAGPAPSPAIPASPPAAKPPESPAATPNPPQRHAEKAQPASRDDAVGRLRAGSTDKPAPGKPDARPGATSTVPPVRSGEASSPPPGSRTGIGGLLTAGLLGGVAGAAIAAFLMQVLPPRADPATAERLAAVERRVAAVPTGPAAGTLEPRIASLEAGLRQASDDAKAARASAEAAGQRANEAANRPLPAAVAPDPGLRPALDALAARVEDGAKRADANAASVRDLGTKLGEGLAAGTAALAALDSSVRGAQTDLGTVRTATGALETRSTDAARRLEALTGQVAGVSGDLAKLSPAASQAGLRLVVSGRLDEALRAGAPLGTVVAALERLGVEPALLAPLRPFAEQAAPTPAALAAAFKPLAASLTTETAAETESVAEKVRRLFGKVVTVRAVGDGSGTDLPGLVARIEGALARGAVGEAAAAWDGFPESARRATADWGARLKARAAADDGARRIGSQSLAALDTVAASGAAARPAPSR